MTSVRALTHSPRGELVQSALRNDPAAIDADWSVDGFGRVQEDDSFGSADLVRLVMYGSGSELRRERYEDLSTGTPPTLRRQVLYESDGLGRRLKVCSAASTCPATISGNELLYTWDDKGSFAGQGGLTNGFQRGRLAFVEDKEGATFYEYDVLGRVTKVVRHTGVLSSFNVANLTTTAYAYNALGALESITYPSSRIARYSYGADKARPNGVSMTVTTTATDVPVASNITWDAAGQPKVWLWGTIVNSQHTVTRDLKGQITNLSDKYAGLLRSNVNYEYSPDGDVTQEQETIAPTAQVTGASAPQTQTFSEHPARDVLTGWEDASGNRSLTLNFFDGRRSTETGPEGTYTYGFESLTGKGRQRLVSKTAPGSLTGERTYSYNELGEINNVTLTSSGTGIGLTYNLFGGVATATNDFGTFTYFRDHEQRRVQKQAPTGLFSWARWRYGVGRQPLQELDTLRRTDYIYLAGQPIAAVAQQNSSSISSGKLYYFYADRLGTPRKAQRAGTATIEQRLVMDAWGNGTVMVDAGSAPQPAMQLRRPGQVQDSETGFIDNGYRTLMPDVGQYTSPERMHRAMIMNGAYGPQAYTYARGRPLKYIDPTGLSPYEPSPMQPSEGALQAAEIMAEESSLYTPLNGGAVGDFGAGAAADAAAGGTGTAGAGTAAGTAGGTNAGSGAIWFCLTHPLVCLGLADAVTPNLPIQECMPKNEIVHCLCTAPSGAIATGTGTTFIDCQNNALPKFSNPLDGFGMQCIEVTDPRK